MTDHFLFQEDLKAYADGELSWPRRLAVRFHLTHCTACQEEIIEMTQLTEDLRASEPANALDPALRAKILAAAPGPESSPASSVPKPRKKLALAWALACAAVIAWFVCFPLFQKVRENARTGSASESVFKPQTPSDVSAAPAVSLRQPESVQSLNAVADYSGGSGYPGDGGGGYPGGSEAISSTIRARILARPDTLQRQVDKEASIGVQVPNPEAVSDQVADMVKETGGFVASNTLNTGDDGRKSAELIVKVPVTQFETFLGQVAKFGSVQSKNVSGEDITEKTSDADQTENVLESDVQQSEARLKALGSKAKWRDAQATRDLRIRLAEARARLVLLRRMAALSTITINLSQTPKPRASVPVTGGFLNGLKASTHDALLSLSGSTGSLAALVIWLLAYAPLWLPLLLLGRHAVREYRKRQVGT